ncbi:MAG TPA: DUF4082 domain-containing protein [Rhizomicrobium sp.]|nr:DUF4082 domain-containing protein [Rhizomicrobium sp.]
MKKILAAAAASAVLLFAGAANAGPAWTWATAPTDFTNGSWDFGINFTVTTPVTVTGLGYYDAGGDGFLSSHEVALYNAGGTFLAGGTVVSANVLVSGFRFITVAPVLLAAGNYQVLGVSHSDLYSYVFGSTPGDFLTLDPRITYLGDSYNFDNGSGAAFVGIGTGTVNNDVNNGIFGPNLRLSDAQKVPEPLTVSLFGAGLAGVAAMRRRKKNKA